MDIGRKSTLRPGYSTEAVLRFFGSVVAKNVALSRTVFKKVYATDSDSVSESILITFVLHKTLTNVNYAVAFR